MSKQSQSHGNTGSPGEVQPEPAGQEHREEIFLENSGEGRTEVLQEGPVSADATGSQAAEPQVAAAQQAEAPAEPLSPEEKVADLEVKLAELHDQYLRKMADFENFRKRMNREKLEITEFANQSLLLDLLPIIDDFERAIKSAENSSSLKSSKDFLSFYEGVLMIEKRLVADLENKWGLKRFDSEGQPFDPNRHEALQMEKTPGISEAVVKDDFVKGYLLKDRVIRFAKVKVLMPEE